ncbi:MAG: hypothetical protein NWR08_04085 [Opitutales bacterium]|jgi:hypothetical protein|nr:hypothetical protein [Opitutales bacterium]
MNRTFSPYIIAISVSFLCAISFGEEPAQVTIDLSQRQVLGETSELDRSKFFNVHSNYRGSGLTVDNLEQLKELNVGFGRAFDGPFAAHKKGTPYPDTATIKVAAKKALSDAKADPRYAYRQSRYIMTNSHNDVFNMEDAPKEMARFAVDILEYNYEDDFRPDFYAPMSIPFVAAGKYGNDQAAVRERMTELYAEVGKEIDRRALATQVIGYSSAWPMIHYWDFGHWHERMKMFMDNAGPYVDGFCFLQLDATHMQEDDQRRSGSRAEALMDLIETYGFIKWGAPKPHAISEYGDVSHGWPLGDDYTPARSSAELNSCNHFLFSLLGRQDRIMIAVPFLTTKSPWFYQNPKNEWQPFSADLWRPDPESIQDGVPTRFMETEKMEFYRLWSDVAGHRVKTTSTDPDILSYAFVDQEEVFICLNNFEDDQRTVDLNFAATLPELKSLNVKRMFVPKQQAVIYTKKSEGKIPTQLIMEPHETIILHGTFTKEVETVSTITTKSHYSRTYLQPIKANHAVTFTINDVTPSEGSTGTLRISIAREHNLSKQPTLSVNGHDIEFPNDWTGYDQANKKGGFFGAIPIQLGTGILRAENEITLTFPDDGGWVSTATLESCVPTFHN